MVARAWREQITRYRVVGTKCTDCGELSFPPRRVCPKCKSRKWSDFTFKGDGTLQTYTRMYSVPKGHEEDVPITIGIVSLEEGPEIMAQIVDYETLKIGEEVEYVFRKVDSHTKNDVIHYAAKFRPKATWNIGNTND